MLKMIIVKTKHTRSGIGIKVGGFVTYINSENGGGYE